jgi:hypothetical protein
VDRGVERGVEPLQRLEVCAWEENFTGTIVDYGTWPEQKRAYFRDSREVLRFAFSQNLSAAGMSTIDIGGILSNVANKFLLEGFFSVDRQSEDVMAEDLKDKIKENAEGPESAEADGVKSRQHSLRDQIEADKYLSGKDALAKKNFGLTRGKIVPPGTV